MFQEFEQIAKTEPDFNQKVPLRLVPHSKAIRN